jgi:hypothetical protein
MRSIATGGFFPNIFPRAEDSKWGAINQRAKVNQWGTIGASPGLRSL